MALFHSAAGYSREVKESIGKWSESAHRIIYDAGEDTKPYLLNPATPAAQKTSELRNYG
jgi:hypothetical protein